MVKGNRNYGRQEETEKQPDGSADRGIDPDRCGDCCGSGGVFYYRSQKAAEEAVPDASGYEELMKSYYSAIVSGDGKKMAQLMAPPEYWNYYMETYDKSETDVEDALKEGCAATYSGWQNTYGTDVKVSYQIAGMSEQGQDGLNEWNANMEEMLGNDGADMTESVLLEVKVTYSGSTSEGTEIIHPTLGKIGDQWYLISEDTQLDSSSAAQ